MIHFLYIHTFSFNKKKKQVLQSPLVWLVTLTWQHCHLLDDKWTASANDVISILFYSHFFYSVSIRLIYSILFYSVCYFILCCCFYHVFAIFVLWYLILILVAVFYSIYLLSFPLLCLLYSNLWHSTVIYCFLFYSINFLFFAQFVVF